MTIRTRLIIQNTLVIAVLTSSLGGAIYAATKFGREAATDQDLARRADVARQMDNRPRPFMPEPGPPPNERIEEEAPDPGMPRMYTMDGSFGMGRAFTPLDPSALAKVRKGRRDLHTTVWTLEQGEREPQEVRVYTGWWMTSEGGPHFIQLGAEMGPVREEVGRLGGLLLVIVPASWVAAALAAWLLTSLALQPIRRLTAAAGALMKGSPGERLPEDSEDEMGRLAGVINQGLSRIEEGYRRLERFVGDASHELRSPLTAIQLQASLAPPDDPAGMAESLSEIRESAAGMKGIIEDLLLMARLGGSSTHEERISLKPVVEMAAKDAEVHLGDRLTLGALEDLEVMGEPRLLQRLVANLLENAASHAGPEARVQASVTRQGSQALVIVEDDGVGIPQRDLPRVTERFYRVDAARTHEEGWQGEGSGLGLAIVKGIVERHRGSLVLESEEGRGVRVKVLLPLASASGT